MIQHVLLGVVAPPLLLLGMGPAMAALLLRRVPALRQLVRPVPAQVIAAVVMIGWHLPLAYDLALAREPVHILEHLTYIGAGLLFWWPVLGATSSASGRWMAEGVKLLYLVAGTLAQDGVALILQFSRVPFYELYVTAARGLPALDPVFDQTLAGVILQVAGKISYLIAGLTIFNRWVATERGDDLIRS